MSKDHISSNKNIISNKFKFVTDFIIIIIIIIDWLIEMTEEDGQCAKE